MILEIDAKKLENSDPLYGKWILEIHWSCHGFYIRCNLTPVLAICSSQTADEIRLAALETYSWIVSDAQLYELMKRGHEIKQGEKTVAEYYAKLRALWQEIDYYEDFQATSVPYSKKYQSKIDKLRMFNFLAGLNQEYVQIRAQILSNDPFPTLMQSDRFVQWKNQEEM